MAVGISRRCFNVTEYYRMAEAGILSEDDRVELIEGEVIEMNPIGSRHAACVNRLNMLLSRQTEGALIVSVQNPIRLNNYSEPEPDIVLLRPREDFYVQGHPTPSDVLLVIEVADTSGEYDRNIKVPLYARAGIPELWLIDLSQDTVEIFTQPLNGMCQTSKQVKRGGSLVSQALPQVSVSADAILG
jgi:Uma2 family endonuclease